MPKAKIIEVCVCGELATPEHMQTHQRSYENRPVVKWESAHGLLKKEKR